MLTSIIFDAVFARRVLPRRHFTFVFAFPLTRLNPLKSNESIAPQTAPSISSDFRRRTSPTTTRTDREKKHTACLKGLPYSLRSPIRPSFSVRAISTMIKATISRSVTGFFADNSVYRRQLDNILFPLDVTQDIFRKVLAATSLRVAA